jgi:hypothetical protein
MASTDLFTTFYTRDAAGATVANLQYNGEASALSLQILEHDANSVFGSNALSASLAGTNLFGFVVTKGSVYTVIASITAANGSSSKVHWRVDPNRRRVGASKKRAAPEGEAAAAPAAAAAIDVAPTPVPAAAAAADAAPAAAPAKKAKAPKKDKAEKTE